MHDDRCEALLNKIRSIVRQMEICNTVPRRLLDELKTVESDVIDIDTSIWETAMGEDL